MRFVSEKHQKQATRWQFSITEPCWLQLYSEEGRNHAADAGLNGLDARTGCSMNSQDSPSINFSVAEQTVFAPNVVTQKSMPSDPYAQKMNDERVAQSHFSRHELSSRARYGPAQKTGRQ